MILGNKLRFAFLILAVSLQVFIFMDINKHTISFHQTCEIEMTTLNPLSLLFCKGYLQNVERYSGPLVKALEISPESTFKETRARRKKIMQKLHTDNSRTGDHDLFIMAEDFYSIVKFNFRFQVQKRNLLIFGRTVEDKTQSRMNKDLYSLTREMGWRISWAVMFFVAANFFFLYFRYHLWVKIVYFFFSLTILVLPIILSFILKFSLIEMTKTSDFVSEFYVDCLGYMLMVWDFFPGFCVQDLELWVLHVSCFWTLILMVSFPLRKKENMHKELNEIYRDINRLEKSSKNMDVERLNKRVADFQKKYVKPTSIWDKIKKYGRTGVTLLCGIGLPLFLKFYMGSGSKQKY